MNCGGCINLLELLQPEEEDVRFFIIDSRRPFELDNVYNQEQVNLVMREGEELEIPSFDDIYTSDVVGVVLVIYGSQISSFAE